MEKELSEEQLGQLRMAARCDHALHTVLVAEVGRRVIRCHTCKCRITNFSDEWRPSSNRPALSTTPSKA